MDLSVVIPAFNNREGLQTCLDTLSRFAPDAETIIVNGPSTDGTTGMIHERDDVSVLVETTSRNINVARNAGLAEATGEVIALLQPEYRIKESWPQAVWSILSSGAAATTGPTYGEDTATYSSDALPKSIKIAGRTVMDVFGGNFAVTRDTMNRLDGFDEYLEIGGAKDLAHRLAGRDYAITWNPKMGIIGRVAGDGGEPDERSDRHLPDANGNTSRYWCLKYQSLTYSLVKNYGFRPSVARHVTMEAMSDAVTSAREVLHGSATASTWIGSGVDVMKNVTVGAKDGFLARWTDRSQSRNPNGFSQTSAELVVESYDWR